MSRTARWLAIALLLPVPISAQTPAQQHVRRQLGPPGVADTTTALALSAAFRAASERVLPAVVFISVVQEPTAMMQEEMPLPFRFPPGPQQPRRGSGSGVIVDAQGHILTNNHVVADASELTVVLVDGREFSARVIGGNVETDIAVIKIDAPGESLPIAVLGDSDGVRVGDWVLALGNPLGLNFTVTAGIVSATGRAITQSSLQLEAFIQTDAVINPGNSGGPLIDLFGRVIGVNSAIFGSDRFVGYGFAVPITLARRVMSDLLEFGYLRRPRLGVSVNPVTAVEAELYSLPEVRGALVTSVQDDLPAQRAGIRMGDVVVSVNGSPIVHDTDFVTRLARLQPNEEVTLGIIRDGRPQNVHVTLGEFPRAETTPTPAEASPEEAPAQVLGFAVTDLTPQIAQEVRYRGEGGVIVRQVMPGSGAARARIGRGSIVLAINGQRVNSEAQVREIAGRIAPGSPVAVIVHDANLGEVLVTYRARQ
jgi:serine protease Do